MSPEWQKHRQDLEILHAAALNAAAPGPAVRRHLHVAGDRLVAGPHSLPMQPGGHVHVIAFGKASVGMAQAARDVLGKRVGATIVSHPHGVIPLSGANVRCFEAGHPIPDRASIEAGDAVVEHLAHTGAEDVILVLVSGGGSALLESLHEGLSLETLRELTGRLQRAGADIHEMNTVRRALSRLKGGGLARLAAPSPVVALLLSDVMGDNPQTIASGPTVASPTGPAEALEVLRRYGLGGVGPVVALLEARRATPAPDMPAAVYAIVGSNGMACDAVVAAAAARGFRSTALDAPLAGEARHAGLAFAQAARMLRDAHEKAEPTCIVAGGETTVTVTGDGRGGRNQEFALGAARELDGVAGVALLSFGTDGIDGASRAAGAVVTGETIRRAREFGLSVDDALARNDTEAFFDALGDLWITGPTGTNVNDVAIALFY